jgi:hypothetical protein
MVQIKSPLMRNRQHSKMTNSKRPRSKITYTFAAALSIVLICSVSYAILGQNLLIPTAHASQSTPTLDQTSKVQTVELAQYNPRFNINMLYAYIGPRTDHFTSGNPLQNETAINTLYAKSLYPSLLCFNITSNSITESDSYEAKLEVYQIQFYSDNGLNENYTYFVATNCQSSFTNANALNPAISQIGALVNINNTDRVNGNFAYDIISSNRTSSGRVGSLGMFTSKPSDLGLWQQGQPNAVTISITRLGLIAMKGTTMSIFKPTSLTPTDTVQLKLQKLGDGFVYNALVSQEQIAKMDPFQPPTP